MVVELLKIMNNKSGYYTLIIHIYLRSKSILNESEIFL